MNSEVTRKSVPTLYGTIKRVPQVDNTLTKAGCYADAKAVGDILREEQRAVNFSYDSNGNGLKAETIQDAIDELKDLNEQVNDDLDELTEKAVLTEGGYGTIDKDYFKCMFGSNGSATHFYTDVRCHQSDTDKATLRIQTRNDNGRVALPDIIQLQDLRNGTLKQYRILGDHNKPTGSYTGDGSTTKRAFDTKGLGNIVFVTSKEGICIVTNNGAICKVGTTLSAINSSECSFVNGVFTLTTTNIALNKNGLTYNYQVL